MFAVYCGGIRCAVLEKRKTRVPSGDTNFACRSIPSSNNANFPADRRFGSTTIRPAIWIGTAARSPERFEIEEWPVANGHAKTVCFEEFVCPLFFDLRVRSKGRVDISHMFSFFRSMNFTRQIASPDHYRLAMAGSELIIATRKSQTVSFARPRPPAGFRRRTLQSRSDLSSPDPKSRLAARSGGGHWKSSKGDFLSIGA